jgi:hypothetical protein
MDKFIIFRFNRNNFAQQYAVMEGTGLYDSMEECVNMVEIWEKKFPYEFYTVYISGHSNRPTDDDFKYIWYHTKTLVSKRFEVNNSTISCIPQPLQKCYSNDLKKFYFN